jgi:MFS family permease
MASPASAPRLTTVQWLICIIAAIGFAFDIYELLMMPLIIRPALMELGGYAPGDAEFARWGAALFYVPALCGGIFGLMGGYLTDRLGRRRVLTWSILLYAVSAFLAGFSTNLWMLLFFRTTTFIGVCVEFVAAVAWLAELFDDPHQRERVLGYTQAFSSFGGLLVAVANGLAIAFATRLPAISIPGFLESLIGQIDPAGHHAPWRYTLMSGLIPAIPLIVIRPFLPESPKWQAKKAAGTLKRPSIGELFQPALRRTTIVTTLMFACSYGVAFGALQQIPQIVAGLDTVQAEVAAKTAGQPEAEAKAIRGRTIQAAGANYTKAQELGGLAGRFLLAVLVVRILSRRKLLRVFLLPGLIIVPLVFLGLSRGNETVIEPLNITVLGAGVFLAGLYTVAQFSFWGNYLPGVYPLHLRGTGESFAANIGGRMLGTPFFGVTQYLALIPFMPGASPPAKLALTAAGVALMLFAANIVLSFFLPEPEYAGSDD